jgi:hypothetical protein
MSSDPFRLRSDAVEGTLYREPEWEPVEPGIGQPPTMREYFFDPIHGWYYSTGPKVVVVRWPPVAPP